MATKRKKDKNGYYVINRAVAPYKDKNGKVQTYKKFYGKTVGEAVRKYDEYVAGADRTPEFFDDLIEEYINDTFLPNPSLKPRTKQRYLDGYRKNLEPQKWFIHMPIKDITYNDVQKAYDKMTCKPSGVEACHKLLKPFFNTLIARGIIDRNPTDTVAVPKPSKKTHAGEIITFTDEEIDKIKKYISRHDLPAYEQKRVDRLRLLIIIAMNTGARASEMLALRYQDITQDSVTINKQVLPKPVFKDGKTSGYELTISDTKSDSAVRTIPINTDLWQSLQEHKTWHEKEMSKKKYKSEFIFTTSSGQLYDRRSVQHSIDRILSVAGVTPQGLHTFRRTFGTKLARKGTPVQVLRDLMGHEDIQTTLKYYISISSDEKRKAIESLA